MTRITFYTHSGIFYGFEEKGHTGYGDSGDDVLCAALSAMTMLIINAAEVAYESEADYTISDETADISLIVKAALPGYEQDERRQYALSGLIKAYYYQLMDLTEEYYDYLEVEVKERDPDGE